MSTNPMKMGVCITAFFALVSANAGNKARKSKRKAHISNLLTQIKRAQPTSDAEVALPSNMVILQECNPFLQSPPRR